MITKTKQTEAKATAKWQLVIVRSLKLGNSYNFKRIELNLKNDNFRILLSVELNEYDDNLYKLAGALNFKPVTIEKNPKVLLNQLLLIKVYEDEYSEFTQVEDIKPVLNNEILENMLNNNN